MEVKQWLDKIVPGGLKADHGAFPTEYVGFHSHD